MSAVGYRKSLQNVGFVLALVAAACNQAAVSSQRLINVGQRKLFINCSGQRHGPAVILESGMGESSDSWSKVQPEIARLTEVCSYDRAGFGKSTPLAAPLSVSADETIQDLHSLLKGAAISPPYVLVGASAGGIFVRRFTSKYPDEVKGMVLADSAHEEQLWRFLDIDATVIQGVSLKPDDIRRMGFLPPRERFTWHDDIPLIVLQHGVPIPMHGSAEKHQAEFEAAKHSMQQDLAGRSRYGELRTAEHSGHRIWLEQPDMVIQAIKDVLDRVSRKQ